MKATEQAKGQNMYQHGLSVFRYLNRLINNDTEGFRLPQWYDQYKETILENLHEFKTLKHYTIFHDCGKSMVKVIDDNGKIHYPNHAEASSKLWFELFPHRKDESRLMLHDLDFHTLKFEEIVNQNLSIQDIATLMLTALAELHANANMFGSIESDSFKIKFKKYEKLGKKICEKYFNHAYMYILVRNDLSNAQKAVQSGHAILESTRNYIKTDDEHPSIILCTVKSEQKLLSCAEELRQKGVDFQLFHEPDIQNQCTALASKPLVGKDRKVFSRFQLLT